MVITNRAKNWAERKIGHMFVSWETTSAYFTKPQLIRLQKHFYHPSAEKLMELLKRSHPSDADEKTRSLIKEISEACKTCQTFSVKPQRFRVSLPPENMVFNREVALDLMWISRRAVLHAVDMDTNFSSAIFLKEQTVEGVWRAFVMCWCSLYPGYPETIHVDQGSCFTSVRWEGLCEMVGLQNQKSGVESHN